MEKYCSEGVAKETPDQPGETTEALGVKKIVYDETINVLAAIYYR